MKSHDTESFLSLVIENISEGICVCHNIDEFPYIRFTLWNEKMFELTGYTADQINLSGWYQTLYPDPAIQGNAIKRMKKMRQGDNLRNEVWEITRADGQKRHVSISTAIVEDKNHTTHTMAVMRDVTDFMQADEKLHESEKRFKELAEMLPEAVFEADMDINLTYANKHALLLFGYTNQDLENGLNGIELLVPEDRERARENLSKRLQGEELGLVEYHALKKIGSAFPVLMHTSPIIQQGTLKGVRGILIDTTRIRQADELLLESKLRYQNLVESTSDWVWEVDEEGTYTYVSPRIKDLLGYGPEEVMHKTPFDLMPPEEAERLREIFAAAVARHAPIKSIENINLHKDGHPVILETSGTPFFDVEGKFCGYRGIDRDITARKQTEMALRKSEARLQSIFSAAPTGIGVVVNRVIVEVNNRVCDMTGRSKDELIGKSARILYPTQEEFEFVGSEKYQQISTLGFGSVETRWVRKDGSILDVFLSSSPITPNDLSAGVTFTATDISERKQTEKKLSDQREKLKETNAALRVILRESETRKIEIETNVLSNIKDLLLPYVTELASGPLAEEQRFFVDIIKTNINEITSSFSRKLKLESDDLTPREIQVADLIRQGRTNKEIARLLNITASGVDFHRRNLRKKLHIKDTKKNLRSHLLSYVV